MRLPKPGRTTKIVILAGLAAILILAGTLYVHAQRSLLPASINMGSHPDPHGSHRPGVVSVTDLKLGATNAPLRTFSLTAQIVKRAGLPDAWTFNGTVPGPELRVRQGDHVRVTLTNALEVPTSIHWHGINVPNAADGIAGVTQDGVKPGQSYTYDFLVNDVGTYWYHSHQEPFDQIPRGLLGALIVEPTQALAVDRDYTLVYHDRTPPPRTFFSVVGKILGNRDRSAIAVNNTNGDLRLQARPGERVRLRLVNATAGEATAYGDPLRIVPVGVSYRVVALDGHDLTEPAEISDHVLPVGSGQRYDVEFTMPSVGGVTIVDKDQSDTVTLGPGSGGTPALETLPTFDFTAYGKPAAAPLHAASRMDATHNIALGSEPGFHNGAFGLVHTINGKEFPDVPMITVFPGQTVMLHLTNPTDEFHPMHLHGHVFTVIGRNGHPMSGSPVRLDSLLVAPDETWDVAFVADNPGLWMLHCHVLAHAETGMGMMLVYPNISTPFTVGRKSGNFPD